MSIDKTKPIPELKPDQFLFDIGLSDNAGKICNGSDFTKSVSDAIKTLNPFIKKNIE